MEDLPKREILSVDSPDTASSLSKDESGVLRPNGSHGVALNRPFGGELSEEDISEQKNIAINLTVRLKVKLSPRQKSLLLDVLNYQAVHNGVTFNAYLAMITLYLDLRGSKDISDGSTESLVTLTVTELILKTFKDFLFPLEPGAFCHLPERIKVILSDGLMSKRTYGSRFISWRPEFFLQVLAVPVDCVYLNSERNSQPYDSYCKGYGESHPSAHRHKTKFSSELDVDVAAEDRLEELNLLVRSVHPRHKLSERLMYEYRMFVKEKD